MYFLSWVANLLCHLGSLGYAFHAHASTGIRLCEICRLIQPWMRLSFVAITPEP